MFLRRNRGGARTYKGLPALLRLTGADVTLIPAMLIGRSQHIRATTGSARKIPRVALGSRSKGRATAGEASAIACVEWVVVEVVVIIVKSHFSISSKLYYYRIWCMVFKKKRGCPKTYKG
jgi:hypothetical protein